MTAALILAAVIVSVSATVAVLYPRHAEDHRDADEAFAKAERMTASRKRAWERLRLARSVPWLITRYPGRFVARKPEVARLINGLDDMRETARKRAGA